MFNFRFEIDIVYIENYFCPGEHRRDCRRADYGCQKERKQGECVGMKILVVCQYYYPEPVRITDICEELVKRGHEVTVLTGVPNYPMGIVHKDYRHGKRRDEFVNGVHVVRCFTIGRRHGTFFRVLNYFSYPLSATVKLHKLDKDFDIVFVNQLSPAMMAWPAIRYKKKYKKKLVLYCLDLWPESLEVGGIKKGSFIYRIFHRISEKIYKQADKILATSRSFDEYFEQEFGIDKKEIGYLPQYAEEIFTNEQIRIEKKKDTYDFMFAGNIGIAQSVETIIEAANYLKEHKNVHWHIVGDGIDLENCKKKAKEYGLESVTFHGRKPVSEMPKYYAMADAMLVTMIDNPIISKTLPGKVQTYMAAGKPIIGAINGEGRRIIEKGKCGICGKSGDSKELARNIIRFINEKNNIRTYELNSRKYYNENFRKDMFIDRLEEKLG